jgi:hypothetical protein
LAVIGGPVAQFAQSRGYLAWMTPPNQKTCITQLTLLDPGTRRGLSWRGIPNEECQMDALAVAGRRAYWQSGISGLSNYDEELDTEAPGKKWAHTLGDQLVGVYSLTRIVPVSSDGSSVYAVTESGAIRRWVGLRSHPVTGSISFLTALGAGGGRFAFATLTKRKPAEASIVLKSHDQSSLRRFDLSGRVSALAVSASTLAALVKNHSRSSIEIFLPHPRTVVLPRSPSTDFTPGPSPRLSASGSTIVYHFGKAIYALDGRRGGPHVIGHAASWPIGLSIVGRRVAWAESGRHASHIRAIDLP